MVEDTPAQLIRKKLLTLNPLPLQLKSKNSMASFSDKVESPPRHLNHSFAANEIHINLRHDAYGNPIVTGEKEHKVTFKDLLDDENNLVDISNITASKCFGNGIPLYKSNESTGIKRINTHYKGNNFYKKNIDEHIFISTSFHNFDQKDNSSFYKIGGVRNNNRHNSHTDSHKYNVSILSNVSNNTANSYGGEGKAFGEEGNSDGGIGVEEGRNNNNSCDDIIYKNKKKRKKKNREVVGKTVCSCDCCIF